MFRVRNVVIRNFRHVIIFYSQQYIQHEFHTRAKKLNTVIGEIVFLQILFSLLCKSIQFYHSTRTYLFLRPLPRLRDAATPKSNPSRPKDRPSSNRNRPFAARAKYIRRPSL